MSARGRTNGFKRMLAADGFVEHDGRYVRHDHNEIDLVVRFPSDGFIKSHIYCGGNTIVADKKAMKIDRFMCSNYDAAHKHCDLEEYHHG